EHTLFALPFAYGGLLLAAVGGPVWVTFGWITLAILGALTGAMAAKRVIDARGDAADLRIRDREIPNAKLGGADGLSLSLAGLTLVLLPVAVGFLVAYPYTKRFTWLCHAWLGVTIGAAAAGGYIAVSGAFDGVAWAMWLGVGAWVAGFDVVYALLDVDFDRRH